MKPRKLTLTRAIRDRKSHYGYVRPTEVPLLRVQGKWMEQAGFHIGNRVRVEVQPGRLVLTLEDD
jgi:hypothetical protein